MANPSPNTEQLVKFASKWIKTGNKPRATKLVRIPEDLLDDVLAIAHKLDSERHGHQN